MNSHRFSLLLIVAFLPAVLFFTGSAASGAASNGEGDYQEQLKQRLEALKKCDEAIASCDTSIAFFKKQLATPNLLSSDYQTSREGLAQSIALKEQMQPARELALLLIEELKKKAIGQVEKADKTKQQEVSPETVKSTTKVGSARVAPTAITPGPAAPARRVVPEPAAVTRMSLQAGKRTVQQGQIVTVPIWLLKAQSLANMNFNLRYDPGVATATGAFSKGNLMDGSIFQANRNESGIVRVGFTQNADLSGDGTVVQLTFQANGAPGTRTPLTLEVTTISGAGGGKPTVDLIHGEIVVVGTNGTTPGDSDGDGQITARDAGDALKMSVRLIPENKVSDFDRDGQVTSTDARLILAKVSGK